VKVSGKVTGPARLAALGMASALLLAFPAARASDAVRPAKSPKTASGAKPAAKSGLKTTRSMDVVARRAIAGGPTAEDISLGAESAELRALRYAERELFPPAAPAPGNPWPPELPFVLRDDGEPQVRASGVPPGDSLALPPTTVAGDLSWLTRLEMPDLPVRWDERVIRYLEFFRDDPRGHTMFANLVRHSGRFRDLMRRALRRKALPEDLVWVSMIESGFDAAARSPSGAAGLWQFMPETGKIYGLALDRWVDQRYCADLATAAATDLLGDLHRRFGSWELALAGYNMGYAGLASVVRRYNTNDFWSLARTEGTLPWETTLYVPKILAAAVVAHNMAAFGFGDLVYDFPVEYDQVDAPAGMSLASIAQVAGCDAKDLEALNPELRAARTPPIGDGDARYPLKVPQGKGAALAQVLAKMRRDQPALDRYVVRFGETLEQIALSHRTSTQKLVELNSIGPGEVVRGGTVLFVPKTDGLPSPLPPPSDSSPPAAPRQSVVVPSDEFVYPNRQHVFYRVRVGDTLKEIAGALRASADDLCRWNDLDPGARLQEGMTLQAFVPEGEDLSQVAVVPEAELRIVAVGSEEFFASMSQPQGKSIKRVVVAARAGDTLASIGKRFDVSPRTMERINRRSRADTLKLGEPVVVYVPTHVPSASASGAMASTSPAPNGPLPPASPAPAPVPDLLP
jgi:membrane-bound lytic murein transglycosylase D